MIGIEEPELGLHPDILPTVAELLRKARADGAVLAVLPENFALMGLQETDKLAAAENPGRGPIQERLDYLESVLAVMCGAHTAARALRAAAVSSPARSLQQVNRDNWEPFLENLASIATVMCGETGAHLVRRSGEFY